MLTQDDLIAIGRVIDNRLDLRLKRIEKKLGFLDKKIDRLDRSMNKKLDVVINYFEYRDVNLEKRVNRIKSHLGLTPLNS